MSNDEGVHRVPIINLSPFTAGGDLDSRKKTAEELAQKVSTHGCIGITGHGIDIKQLAAMFSMAKALFDLPYEEKMKAPHPDATTPHRGYSGFGREQAAAKSAHGTDDDTQKSIYENTTDFKESYEIGSEENKVDYNIWLPEDVLPGFRTSGLDFYWTLDGLARSVMEALILSLNIDKDEAELIKALYTSHDNQLRLLHYPIVPAKLLSEQAFSRLGAHTDWGLFTLLFQDGNGGLEFQDRQQPTKYIPAPSLEGVVYMNIGDCFERISNGLYPSAMHRVVIHLTKETQTQNARYSIPYFVGPRLDGLIQTPASLVEKFGGERYPPLTFEAYSMKMFQAVNKY